MDLLNLYSNFFSPSFQALQELINFFSGRGSSIFRLGYKYL
ncbi:hypothetical protein FDUTEX481_02113 [Tolypothrix sp. PCC 7601]|nr:hypothetical protein FDUTEX481_02113 [Tolypothrix sp. PCC 7601]